MIQPVLAAAHRPILCILVAIVLMLGCGESEQQRIAEKLASVGGVVVADDDLPNDRVVRVVLRGSQVSDDQLVHLTDLEHLRHLYLDDSQITNDGIAGIGKLSAIELLSIRNTQIDDKCLSALAEMKSLKWLYISQTELTPRGIRKLRKALPNTMIVE